jgi:hypothetical protein
VELKRCFVDRSSPEQAGIGQALQPVLEGRSRARGGWSYLLFHRVGEEMLRWMPIANSDGCLVAKRRNIRPAAIRSARGSSVVAVTTSAPTSCVTVRARPAVNLAYGFLTPGSLRPNTNRGRREYLPATKRRRPRRVSIEDDQRAAFTPRDVFGPPDAFHI